MAHEAFLFSATDREPPHPLIFDALVVRSSLNWNFLDSNPCCSTTGVHRDSDRIVSDTKLVSNLDILIPR